MTMPKPIPFLLLLSVLWGGCATRGPMHLYSAGAGDEPVHDQALESGEHVRLPGFLDPDDRVIGLGYEHNTDYIWLRLAPGNRLITIKRGIKELWYDYALPDTFMMPSGQSGDLAVRSFNRMVYVAMPTTGAVAAVSRYGDVRETFIPGDIRQTIGGLAWDQVNDRLLVLYAESAEVVAFDPAGAEVERIRLQGPIHPQSLAYDSNRARFYVPLPEAGWLGEFDADGRRLNRLAWPDGMTAIDAGQRSLVRVF